MGADQEDGAAGFSEWGQSVDAGPYAGDVLMRRLRDGLWECEMHRMESWRRSLLCT